MSDVCEYCGSRLTGSPGKGRPRKYCGDPCRQAAHRQRRLGTGAAAPSSTAPGPETAACAPASQAPTATAARTAPPARTAGQASTSGDELLSEIARDIQEGARDLARLLPSLNGEEPLQRIVQLREQLDGLTAAAVGRARHRRIPWTTISSVLGISEDTARHRYTDRYILRRLARFNRSQTPLTSLAGLFTPAAPAAAAPPDPPGENAGGGESGDAGGDHSDGPDTPERSTQTEPAPAAYNRLAPILSMLVRSAQLTNKEVSSRIGCSASYLSRILSGERVPTWELTRKFAHVCGADPDVLRTVWESEKLSDRSPWPEPDPDAPPLPAAEQLRAAIRTLHLRAGRPAPSDIAVASRWLLTAGTIASLLECTVLPPRDLLQNFVLLLGGDVDHFTQLLDDAHREATRGTHLLQAPAPPDPTPSLPRHAPQAPPAHAPRQPAGPDSVMKTFSKVLTEERTVEDGRARLLHKLAEESPHADSDRRRPVTLTDALRQRRRPPASITPLRTV
ncbi:helix-turn-helix domain-containing protein [Streptomyces griseosporeus]|uniref:helix-turn-helix domain-containing protein n=1 Tax=Streptomyces griseosporeus TaxID=1910 RepID=UPI0037B26206